MTRSELMRKYNTVLDYLEVVSESYMDRDNIERFIQQLVKDLDEMEE